MKDIAQISFFALQKIKMQFIKQPAFVLSGSSYKLHFSFLLAENNVCNLFYPLKSVSCSVSIISTFQLFFF